MKKYTKTYLIQLLCVCIFMAMSLTGLYNYDPNNQMMFSIVGGVGILLVIAFTMNFFSMRKKNRD